MVGNNSGFCPKILTNLSVPSVIFADASWYASLRGGIEVGGGNDASFKDGFSRWGIKGSSEISEGLSAVYRFEHKISTENASQPGGRLAYAGLSGSFGTVSLGQIWSASFNHVGGITDGSWFYGNSETSYRVGNALSYAMSAGAISMQIDAVMDGGTDTGESVDQLEFGMTVSLGDIGKLGLAYVDTKDSMVTNSVFMEGTPGSYTPGSDGTYTPGTPGSYTPGMDGTYTPGMDGTYTPGSDGTYTPGSDGTYTPGSDGTYVPGTPGEYKQGTPGEYKQGTPTVPSTVTVVPNLKPMDFMLMVGEDGQLVLSEETKKMYPTADYDQNDIVSKTYVSADGMISGTKAEDEEKFEATPMRITYVGAPLGETGLTGQQQRVDDDNPNDYRKVGDRYVANACYEDGEVLTTSGCVEQPAYKVEYFVQPQDTEPVFNPVTNTETIPGNVANISIVKLSDDDVMHTVEGTITDGQVTTVDDTNFVPGTPGEYKQGTPGEYKQGTPGSYTKGSDGTYTPGSDGTYTPGSDGTYTPGTDGTYTQGTDGTYTPGTDGTYTQGTDGTYTPGTASHYDDVTTTVKGSRATHVAAQFSLGAITAYLGYSQNEENGSGMKDKTTHYGVSGGLGETGISFHAMARNKDNASGMDSNPWLVGLTKGLGGGATVMVEHGNDDEGASGKTRFGLKVDF